MFNVKNSNIFLKGYSLLRNTECRVHTHFFTPSHLVHQQVPSASRFSGQLYSITTFSFESSNLSLLSAIQFYDIVYDIVRRNSVLTIRESLRDKTVQTRSNTSPGGSEEVGYLVTKTGVIRMFHDSHKLYAVVS